MKQKYDIFIKNKETIIKNIRGEYLSKIKEASKLSGKKKAKDKSGEFSKADSVIDYLENSLFSGDLLGGQKIERILDTKSIQGKIKEKKGKNILKNCLIQVI